MNRTCRAWLGIVVFVGVMAMGCARQGAVPFGGGHVYRAYCLDEKEELTDWTPNWERAILAGYHHAAGVNGNHGATWHRWELRWRYDPKAAEASTDTVAPREWP